MRVLSLFLALFLLLQSPLSAARPYSQPIPGDSMVVYRLAWVVPGVLLRSGAVVIDGSRLAGDHPADRAAVGEVYEALKRKYRVSAVMNLRSESAEDRAAARACGMRYEHMPILDGSAPTPEQVARFFKFVGTARQRGEVALWHCAGGIGRTGVLAAMLRLTQGWSTRDAAQEMFAMGLTYDQAEEHLPALNAFARALDRPTYYPPDWPYGRKAPHDYRDVARAVTR